MHFPLFTCPCFSSPDSPPLRSPTSPIPTFRNLMAHALTSFAELVGNEAEVGGWALPSPVGWLEDAEEGARLLEGGTRRESASEASEAEKTQSLQPLEVNEEKAEDWREAYEEKREEKEEDWRAACGCVNCDEDAREEWERELERGCGISREEAEEGWECMVVGCVRCGDAGEEDEDEDEWGGGGLGWMIGIGRG